ncbi:MAG: hypothetical protein DME26_23120 [Verrucomicrobia bacterium]|nr:MAG: hypothetical protein DME26_23120 [Verrucomicrobiota bacterium]
MKFVGVFRASWAATAFVPFFGESCRDTEFIGVLANAGTGTAFVPFLPGGALVEAAKDGTAGIFRRASGSPRNAKCDS